MTSLARMILSLLALCLFITQVNGRLGNGSSSNCQRVGACVSCTASELKELYCQGSGFRAPTSCVSSTGAKSTSFESCEVDGSRSFWIFTGFSIAVAAGSAAIVHWRKKRLSHMRDVRFAKMVNS